MIEASLTSLSARSLEGMGILSRWATALTKFLGEHPVGMALVVLGGFAVGLSQVTGLNFRDLAELWKPAAPATLGEEARSALRARVRQLAVDASLSADETQELREYAAKLQLPAEPAAWYLSEIEPGMLRAAKDLQEGAELAAQERFTEARERFREATRLDGDSATAWADFGGAALELGDVAESEAALRRALALQPENVEANYNFAACLAAQGHGAAALDHLERSLTLLLRGEGPPTFAPKALLADLQQSSHFASLRSSPRFAALIRRVRDDFH